jgi:putative oxidoreductase
MINMTENTTNTPWFCPCNLYKIYYRCTVKAQCLLLLAIRLFFGFGFFMAGKAKVFNMDQTIQGFTSMNIPFPVISTYLAAYTEFLGGILLILGLATRLVSLPLAFTMVVAFLTAFPGVLQHALVDSKTFITSSPFPYLFAMLVLICFGAGRISLDYLICKKYCQDQKDSCCSK